jgi:type IV secretion system protein TrbC
MKHMNRYLKTLSRLATALMATMLSCGLAYAQATTGSSTTLPWEAPLQTLQGSLTGPIAKSIAIIALAVAGGMLAFGGELSDFTKRILMVVLAIAVMMTAATFITSLGLQTPATTAGQ